MAFAIKRGDTQPNLPWQILQPDGVTPLDLTTATSVSIAIRHKSDQTLLFKKLCTIQDALAGSGIYDWAAGDTSVPADYEYELEILWDNGDVQTVPVDAYFDLTIYPDID